MDPVTAGLLGGTAVAGAAANYLEGEKNRKANKQELARIEALVNAVQDPNFDLRYITPEDFKLVAQYHPQIAAYIGEMAPELVRGLSPEAQQGLDAQMEALAKFRGLATSGEDLQSRILRDRALRDSQIQNQGQQASIVDRFNRRGQGGSAQELVAALLSQQGSNLAGQRSAEDAAMDVYNTKLNAYRDSANLGSNIRGQALDMEIRNANTINNFNNRVTGSLRDWESDRANTLNDAQLKNISAAQRVSDANTSLHNASRQGHQDKLNSLAQQKFNNDMNKVSVKSKVPMLAMGQNNQNYSNASDLINSLVTGVNKGVAAYSAYGQGKKNKNGSGYTYDDADDDY